MMPAALAWLAASMPPIAIANAVNVERQREVRRVERVDWDMGFCLTVLR
jgi:hypothetical protein